MTVDSSSLTGALQVCDAGAAVVPPAARTTSSYGEIFRSSLLIGGSTALSLAIGLVRTKAIALLLGPGGVGLMGLFTSIADLARLLCGVGINTSGVRQIAQAVQSGDANRIAVTATVLRRTAIVLGIAGTVLVASLAGPIATITFGNDAHADAVTLLSAAVFFSLVAESRNALLQGMRRIADLAKIGTISAVLGMVATIAIVYRFGEDGVAPSLVAIAMISMVTAVMFSREVLATRITTNAVRVRAEAVELLKLGLAFMASGLLTIGAAFVVRLLVVRSEGLEAAGQYQAAWTLGGLYVGFVLQAMATDFYPRLVAAAHDDVECNRIVNEQAHVSLLLAGTGVIATVAFAPLLVTLFYSTRFADAALVLRWICLGMALRVITWPMGYILVAKGARSLFVASDLAWSVVNVALTWWCMKRFGLTGAGIAFFLSYASHWLIVYPIARNLSGFRWSVENLKTGAVFLSLIAAAFATAAMRGPVTQMAAGSIVLIVSAVYSARGLRGLGAALPLPMRRWFTRRSGGGRA